MIYRITIAPPGYKAHQNFMIGAYETVELGSKSHYLTTPDGTVFTATIGEARAMIPNGARLLEVAPDIHFPEVWEADNPISAP